MYIRLCQQCEDEFLKLHKRWRLQKLSVMEVIDFKSKYYGKDYVGKNNNG